MSGLVNQNIDAFPFNRQVSPSGPLVISAVGNSPIYVTAYQEYWETQPALTASNFVVSTSLEGSAGELQAGKPVALQVTVEVKRDAEYVMIEVPIPAGCSYASKPQSWTNQEVHREYYNHKTNIYCELLKKGTYTYSIPLLPRYAGSYTLNPAVAQCMYLPLIKGQEGMKRISIR
jgi:uncharacterized protein YfaS (alpha-2-macroglobulin family)